MLFEFLVGFFVHRGNVGLVGFEVGFDPGDGLHDACKFASNTLNIGCSECGIRFSEVRLCKCNPGLDGGEVGVSAGESSVNALDESIEGVDPGDEAIVGGLGICPELLKLSFGGCGHFCELWIFNSV